MIAMEAKKKDLKAQKEEADLAANADSLAKDMKGAAIANQAAKASNDGIMRREWAKRLFAVYDVDNSGVIGDSEFFELYKVLEPDVTTVLEVNKMKAAATAEFNACGAICGAMDLTGFIFFLDRYFDPRGRKRVINFDEGMQKLMEYASNRTGMKVTAKKKMIEQTKRDMVDAEFEKEMRTTKRKEWAKRILTCFDVDQSGALEIDEFLELYALVPGNRREDGGIGFHRAGAVGGKLQLQAFNDWIDVEFSSYSDKDLDNLMMQMMQTASVKGGTKMENKKLVSKIGEWAPRVMSVGDVDGSGRLDFGEFNLIYDAIPGIDPNAARTAYQKINPVGQGQIDEGIGEAGLVSFLVEAFKGKGFSEVDESLLLIMERLNTATVSKAASKIKSPKSHPDKFIQSQNLLLSPMTPLPGLNSSTMSPVPYSLSPGGQYALASGAASPAAMASTPPPPGKQSLLSRMISKQSDTPTISVTSPATPAAPNMSEWANRVVTVFDMDGNGLLDRQEFDIMYSIVAGLDPKAAGAMFTAAGATIIEGQGTEPYLDTIGFTRFLEAAFSDKPPIVFNAAMNEMMQKASEASGRKADQIKLKDQAAQWSSRVLQIMDSDGSMTLDRGEFNVLYDALPGLEPTGAAKYFDQHSNGDESLDQIELGHFLFAAHCDRPGGPQKFLENMQQLMLIASQVTNAKSEAIAHKAKAAEEAAAAKAKKEIASMKRSQDWAKRIIQVFDLDGNQNLDQTEFSALYSILEPEKKAINPMAPQIAMQAAGAQSGMLDVAAFSRFLENNYRELAEDIFVMTMTRCMESASAITAEKISTKQMSIIAAKRGEEWAGRLLAVLDVDSNGSLDFSEFNLLYELIPSIDPTGAQAAFQGVAGADGVVDQRDLASFIEKALGDLSQPEFDSTVSLMMERASTVAADRMGVKRFEGKAAAWSMRLMAVLDMDGNKGLDEEEFSLLSSGIAFPARLGPIAFKSAKPVDGLLDVDGLTRFLIKHYTGESEDAFDVGLMKLMEKASKAAAEAALRRKKMSKSEVKKKAMEWSTRVFRVMDVDASGSLDQEEFAPLHKTLVPSSDASELGKDFCAHMSLGGVHNGKIEETGLGRFIEEVFTEVSEPDFNDAMGRIMEISSTEAVNKIDNRERRRGALKASHEVMAMLETSPGGGVMSEVDFMHLHRSISALDQRQANQHYELALGRSQECQGVNAEGCSDFLMEAFSASKGPQFRFDIESVVTIVKQGPGQARLKTRNLRVKAGEWSARILSIYDFDGTGLLEMGEFSVIYDCVLGRQKATAEVMFERYRPIDASGLERYMSECFSNEDELTQAVMVMMERGNLLTSSKMEARKRSESLMKNAATWSYRLLQVFDLDGSGKIDRGEFNALYDCVPDTSSGVVRDAWDTYSSDGGIDYDGMQSFLQSAFAGKSQEQFEVAMNLMMERGSLIATATLAQRERSSSPTRDHVVINIPTGGVSDVTSPVRSSSPIDSRAEMQRRLAVEKAEPVSEVAITINPITAPRDTALSFTPPPAANAGMAEACTPELLIKIDEVLPNLFHRYDADCSGTLNTKGELQQLTINLTFNLGLRIRPDVLQGLVKETELGVWDIQEFRTWYTHTALKLVPQKKSHTLMKRTG